jgi:D-galactarolactone cycloisomerase
MPETLSIRAITTYVLRIPRDFGKAIGGAGTPVELRASTNRHTRAATYGTFYSKDLEAFLIKIDAGDFVGWGEAQAPIAPEVCQAILQHVIGPWLLGRDALSCQNIYKSLYEGMRVRGHWNGFYPDALAGIDIALWDIAGKVKGQPVSQLLSPNFRFSVPTYVSGVTGRTIDEQMQFAKEMVSQGSSAFKVFWADSFNDGLDLVKRLRTALPQSVELFVDALWRMTQEVAILFARELAELQVGWLEAPLPPEDIESHAALSQHSEVPIAIGESYRCRYDFERIVRAKAASILQPDLGRCGITLGQEVSELCTTAGLRFAPHVSISMGPQLAAAMHVSAAARSLWRLEVNPQIATVAQRFLKTPLDIHPAAATLPIGPGLGIQIDEDALLNFTTASGHIA